MRIHFLVTTTPDFVDHLFDEPTEKTFYRGQTVEVERIEETVRGFVDLIFENGDAAIGVPKQGLTIL